MSGHTDVADLVPPFRQRAKVGGTRLTVAHERQRHIAIRLRADFDIELVPCRAPVSPTATMRSPRRRPAFSAGDPALTEPITGGCIVIRRHLGALRQHDGHDNHGEQDVHHGTHDEHLEPLPLRLRQELVGRAAARVVRLLAGHLDVAAERNRADRVFGVATPCR